MRSEMMRQRPALRRLVRWAQQPVLFPRWMLTIGYSLYVVLGVLPLTFTIPSLRDASTPAFVNVIGVAVILGSVAALVGATRYRWYPLEAIGGITVALALSSYSIAASLSTVTAAGLDTERVVFAWGIFILSTMPAAQGFHLSVRFANEVIVPRVVSLLDR